MPHSSKECSCFARRDHRLRARDEVIEDDACRQYRADASQHLQHFERVDVLLPAQQDARAARQDERIVAEERLDRFMNPPALLRLADVKRVRSVVDGVVAEPDRLAHAADGAVAFSSTVTGSPASDNRHAADMPAGPAPRTTTRGLVPGSVPRTHGAPSLRSRGLTRATLVIHQKSGAAAARRRRTRSTALSRIDRASWCRRSRTR